MKKKQAAKKVVVLGRIQFKADPRKVLYVVQSSNGVDRYNVAVFDGVVQSCSCPATAYCYHKWQIQVMELSRAEEIARQNDKSYYQSIEEKLDGQYAGDPRFVE